MPKNSSVLEKKDPANRHDLKLTEWEALTDACKRSKWYLLVTTLMEGSNVPTDLTVINEILKAEYPSSRSIYPATSLAMPCINNLLRKAKLPWRVTKTGGKGQAYAGEVRFKRFKKKRKT